MPDLRRWISPVKALARRIVPAPFARLDPLRAQFGTLAAQHAELAREFRALASRVEAIEGRLDARIADLGGNHLAELFADLLRDALDAVRKSHEPVVPLNPACL